MKKIFLLACLIACFSSAYSQKNDNLYYVEFSHGQGKFIDKEFGYCQIFLYQNNTLDLVWCVNKTQQIGNCATYKGKWVKDKELILITFDVYTPKTNKIVCTIMVYAPINDLRVLKKHKVTFYNNSKRLPLNEDIYWGDINFKKIY